MAAFCIGEILEKLGFSGSLSRSGVATSDLMKSLKQLFELLAKEFNAGIAHEPLMITVQGKEEFEASIAGGAELKSRSERLLVSTYFWSLSVRASRGQIEFFMLPAIELPNLEQAELPSRSKLRLRYNSDQKNWCMDEVPINESEMNTLARSLLKDLIVRSQGDYDLLPESTRLLHGGLSLTRSVRSLVAERHALVQKIVNQQEAILSQVARDLHDAVLGNIMLLERSLASGQGLSRDEILRLLTEISGNLRGVCHDIYPRDLKDLGLPILMEEICSTFSSKTGIAASFECVGEFPELTDEVLLHLYRIGQECFNNIGKHASATFATARFLVRHGVLFMEITDNGRGFDIAAIERSGGTSIIRERSELVNFIYPCKISFKSSPHGTTVTVEVVFSVES
ncbi:MAG: hypothetical protein K2X93_14290 [Candidatus Obscuribacterales bacterium]|nr:hypothetical protein [Candidatus Obscuribacterales bacterium]